MSFYTSLLRFLLIDLLIVNIYHFLTCRYLINMIILRYRESADLDCSDRFALLYYYSERIKNLDIDACVSYNKFYMRPVKFNISIVVLLNFFKILY